MSATILDRANWTYAEVRPLRVPPSWKKGQHVTADCSKGVQYLCKWAGAPDPMGNEFGPWGNSQTIWAHLHHLDTAAELEVGDIVTFGPDGDAHAAMVMVPGADPTVWSFGHQGAPDSYKLSEDSRPQTFCKLPVVEPPPSPQDKLRAMTGFYAWAAWRLGEGPFRGEGLHNPAVRPNVPKVISLGWWARYHKFLANRQKGNPPTR
jgi:hypothetical protein